MVQRTLTFDKGLRLFHRALAKGTRLGVTSAKLNISGKCQAAQTIEYVGRKERFMIKYHEVQPRWNDPTTWESVSVIMHVKCRKCEACLRLRRIGWYHRAKFETSTHVRTWFGTLTYSPEEIFRRELLMQRKLTAQGVDISTLSADERFQQLLKCLGTPTKTRDGKPRIADDVQGFLKRLRKAVGRGGIRYLVVSERHKSGVPHWHLLIHEVVPNTVTHRKLKGAWRAGFSDFKLADPKAPGYVAKYISKDVGARVRASEHYGDTARLSVSVGAAIGPSRSHGSQPEREKESLGKELTEEHL